MPTLCHIGPPNPPPTGAIAAKAEVVYSSLQLVRCQLATPIQAGAYTLAVFTRSGMGEAYGVKSATRKITVA